MYMHVYTCMFVEQVCKLNQDLDTINHCHYLKVKEPSNRSSF